MVGKKIIKKGNVKIPINTITKNTDNKKYGIIVLDLDETLFHTDKTEVHFRPKVTDFLVYLNKYFYLVVYTAALKTYADKILDKIKIKDSITAKNLFILKLYRNSVTNNGKDLKLVLNKIVEKDNKFNISSKLIYKNVNQKKVFNYDNIILIDNLVENFIDDQFFNGVPIIDYTGDDKDNALVILTKFFKYFLKKKSEDKKLTLKMYLYNNLYRINPICKIKYQKCK